MKNRWAIASLLFIFAILTSCGNNPHDANQTGTDSAAAVVPQTGATDSANSKTDTEHIREKYKDLTRPHRPGFALDSAKIAPVPSSKNDTVATGHALVYCPSKMIKSTENIVTATITRDDIQKALADFTADISKQENKKSSAVQSDIYQKALPVYNKMEVVLNCDSDIFKVASIDNQPIKTFAPGEKQLEWNWELKPGTTTNRTVITFLFNGIDAQNQPIRLGEKMMYITVKVDARSFFDKWLEFLSDDPKYTITAIVVPFLTFLGGYFLKRKPAKS